LIEKSGGSPDQPVGRIAFLTKEIVESNTLCYSNFIHKIRIDNSEVIPEYIYFYLKAMYNIGFTESMQSQTNGIRNLIMNEYFKQIILLPEKDKQKQIVNNIKTIQVKAKQLQEDATEGLEKAKREVERIIVEKYK
jgi:restriction endonuclease S subunit